jgi:hypothetical protein
VEVEVPGSDFGNWPTEMRRSDGACRYRSCCHGPVSPDQRCYQDVPKDGVFAWEERAEGCGYRAAVRRRMTKVESVAMGCEESRDEVGDCCGCCGCCGCFGCEYGRRSNAPAHLSGEDLPRRRSCGCGTWWKMVMVEVNVKGGKVLRSSGPCFAPRTQAHHIVHHRSINQPFFSPFAQLQLRFDFRAQFVKQEQKG